MQSTRLVDQVYRESLLWISIVQSLGDHLWPVTSSVGALFFSAAEANRIEVNESKQILF